MRRFPISEQLDSARPGASERIKRIFTDSFTAADIAEPLASFDGTTPAALVRALMTERDYDVVGIREEGLIVGFARRDALGDGPCGDARLPLEQASIFADGASLLEVLIELNKAPFAFVAALGRVAGIVTRADIQKPQVRMWLFGLITLIEMRFVELIERELGHDGWQKLLSPGRLEKAQFMHAQRRETNPGVSLVDCLQFSDKGQIVARVESIRAATIYASRRQAEQSVKRLERLRNNLAHAQWLSDSDWETIVELCQFLSNLVDGRQ